MIKNAILFLRDPLEHYDAIGILVENFPLFPLGTWITPGDLLDDACESSFEITRYNFHCMWGVAVNIEYALHQDRDNYERWLQRNRERVARTMREFRSLMRRCIYCTGESADETYGVPYVYPHRINFDVRLKLPSEL